MTQDYGMKKGKSGGTVSRSIRVLHVDDSPEFVEMASTFLRKESDVIDVETRTVPAEGIHALQNEDFDCVISDCTMPDMDMDGVEFRSEVRSEFPDLPFVFFTGSPVSEFPDEVVSDKATAHMRKEIDIEQFTNLSQLVKEVVVKGVDTE